MRVLLADDRAQVRSALRLALGQQPDIQVLGGVADATALRSGVRAVCPDLVLLDWELPGLDALEAVAELRSLRPGLKVIALSGRPEARRAALEAGVDAFVSKGDPPERLLAVVSEVSKKREAKKWRFL